MHNGKSWGSHLQPFSNQPRSLMDNWNEEAEAELIILISLIQEVNKRGSCHNIIKNVCVCETRETRKEPDCIVWECVCMCVIISNTICAICCSFLETPLQGQTWDSTLLYHSSHFWQAALHLKLTPRFLKQHREKHFSEPQSRKTNHFYISNYG